MPKVKAAQGTYRLIGLQKVEKGKWYYGFICKNCKSKIFSLEDETQSKIDGLFIGEGQFSVPCRNCKTDKLIYNTNECTPLQADATYDDGTKRHQPSNRPRQPVTRRYPEASPTFGPSLLERRPECASIIARCIGTWSYIEVALALLLATMLKTNSQPAVAMFLAIQSSRTQLAVLNAVAEVVLSADDKKLFDAIMRVTGAYEKVRNGLAHGLYGFSHLVENGVLWIEQKHNIDHTAKVWASDYANIDTSQMLSNTFVYEPEDLETIAQNFDWLHTMLGFFRGYLGSNDDAWRVKRYDELCSDKRIHEALTALSKKQPKA